MNDSPAAFLNGLGTQVLLSRCIAMMAEIGIADRVAEMLRTGEPAFDKAFGMPFFDYLATHPEIGARFDASMALPAGSALEPDRADPGTDARCC